MHAFFEQQVIDGHRVSEDMNFCRRWRALGGRVWVCPETELTHWGRKSWTGRLADTLQLDRAIAAAQAA